MITDEKHLASNTPRSLKTHQVLLQYFRDKDTNSHKMDLLTSL